MVSFAAALLRGALAVFIGLLFAGGTLTLAADQVPLDRPTLVSVPPEPATLTVPDVQGQAYVFAKGILQDHGFAWKITGTVQGFAANTVGVQRPTPGTVVVDNGAPEITLILTRNYKYNERGTPDNSSPYQGTPIEIPAADGADKPVTTVAPRLEPVPIPVPQLAPTAPGTTPAPTTTTPAPTPVVTTPTPTAPTQPTTPAVTTPAPTTPAPTTTGPRTPDFAVPGAPKEPTNAPALPERASELAQWIEAHTQPSATNLNHWLYEHAFIVAGARFGWWHGAEALETLISADRRAETLWGVGSQSRTTAEKALAEVRGKRG